MYCICGHLHCTLYIWHWQILLEKVADSAREAVKLAEPYKPYGGQFLEFCSISLSTYQICINLPEKSTEFCQFFCRHYPLVPTVHAILLTMTMGAQTYKQLIVCLGILVQVLVTLREVPNTQTQPSEKSYSHARPPPVHHARSIPLALDM